MSELPDLSAPSPADGPTTPGSPAIPRPDAPSERPTERLGPPPRTRRRRPVGTGVGVLLGAVVLVVAVVLVLQNPVPVQVTFLGLRGTLPLGVWLLVAAAVGVLLLGIPTVGRRRQSRRARR